MITQSYLLRDHKGTFDIRSGTLLLRKNDTFLFANYTVWGQRAFGPRRAQGAEKRAVGQRAFGQRRAQGSG